MFITVTDPYGNFIEEDVYYDPELERYEINPKSILTQTLGTWIIYPDQISPDCDFLQEIVIDDLSRQLDLIL